jgi:hypothetical protein
MNQVGVRLVPTNQFQVVQTWKQNWFIISKYHHLNADISLHLYNKTIIQNATKHNNNSLPLYPRPCHAHRQPPNSFKSLQSNKQTSLQKLPL